MRGWVRGVATVVAMVALAGCWPVVGQGPHRQGYNPYERTLTIDNVTTLAPEWDVAAGALNLVAADGVLVVDAEIAMSGYDIATGTRRWLVEPGFRFAFFDAPVLNGGIAYLPVVLVGTETRSYDLQTGVELDGQVIGGGVVAFRGGDVLTDNAVEGPNNTGVFSFRVLDDAGSDWGGVTHIQPIGPPEEVHVSFGTDVVFSAGYGLSTTAPGDGTSGLAVRAFGPEQPASCGPVENPVYACPRWVTPIAGTQARAPVIGPGESTVYAATDAGNVYAVEAATGALQWSASLGVSIAAEPALAEGWLYVPLSTGDVAVFAADGCGGATCSPVWTGTTGGGVTVQPAVAGGVVYVGTDTGSVLAFDAAGCGAATCAPAWTFAMGSPVTSAPIVTGGRLIVGAQSRLVSLRPTPPPAASGP